MTIIEKNQFSKIRIDFEIGQKLIDLMNFAKIDYHLLPILVVKTGKMWLVLIVSVWYC